MQFKQTLLHWTAKRGFTDLVSFLLKRNVDTFIRDSSGKTAKDLAEKKGLSEIVKVKFKFRYMSKIFRK